MKPLIMQVKVLLRASFLLLFLSQATIGQGKWAAYIRSFLKEIIPNVNSQVIPSLADVKCKVKVLEQSCGGILFLDTQRDVFHAPCSSIRYKGVSQHRNWTIRALKHFYIISPY